MIMMSFIKNSMKLIRKARYSHLYQTILTVLCYKNPQAHRLPPLPPLLSDVYRPEYLELQYDKLLQVCEEFYNLMEISPEQINNLEIATKEQSKTKLWFQYRAGRVTASKSKSATCTDPARPSISLIMSVCYPEAYKFTSSATRFK